MADPLRIVLLGGMAELPYAGVAWQVLHYLEGFRRLGHDVLYVEDTGTWPYDPEAESFTDDPAPGARRLARLLDAAGFAGRWAYRSSAPPHELFGLSEAELEPALARADVLVNLSAMTVLGDAHLAVPVRVYLETDPVTPQLEIAQGNQHTIDILAAHTHHFSFGERLGLPGCDVPVERYDYRPTRQPVVLDWWSTPAAGARRAGPPRFTTVSNWEQGQKDIEFMGETYTWSKSVEFLKLLDLPGRVEVTLELALALDDPDTIALLQRAGWRVVHSFEVSRDPEVYRDYIRGSDGEFTVAKDQNVRLRSGWFSDRTATYLAAGKPAVVQDTGFDVALPTGEGLLAFRTADEAVAALEAVAADPERHAGTARAIAEEHLRAETVLGSLLEQVGG